MRRARAATSASQVTLLKRTKAWQISSSPPQHTLLLNFRIDPLQPNWHFLLIVFFFRSRKIDDLVFHLSSWLDPAYRGNCHLSHNVRILTKRPAIDAVAWRRLKRLVHYVLLFSLLSPFAHSFSQRMEAFHFKMEKRKKKKSRRQPILAVFSRLSTKFSSISTKRIIILFWNKILYFLLWKVCYCW